MMKPNLQPRLESVNARLIPLEDTHFEELFKVGGDPAVWANHPNKNRYEYKAFKNFFKGALQSGGAFLIVDKNSGEVAGSTRFYDLDESQKSIFIGYTFYGCKFWGSGLNTEVKKMMLDYIFNYVNVVKFHVGAENYRSIRAMEKLGATKIQELDVAYHGEPVRRNVEFEIRKEDWFK